METIETSTLTMFESTIKYSGDVIFIKPFCDFFGIQYENQCRVIKRHHILGKMVVKKHDTFTFNDKFERYCLPKRGFITWILGLNPSIVQDNLRKKLMQYQELILDYMFGSIEREDRARLANAKLKELRQAKTKLLAEIAEYEADVKDYIEGRLQPRLNFNPSC